jgi:hypothetical protein
MMPLMLSEVEADALTVTPPTSETGAEIAWLPAPTLIIGFTPPLSPVSLIVRVDPPLEAMVYELELLKVI